MSKKPQHSVDPAVASLITGGKQHKKRRSQTKAQREKPRRTKLVHGKSMTFPSES